MSKKDILQVSNVTKYYGKQFALENVTLSICEGEVVGLVGPNGAGKSTLMKIIVGLIRNYDGSVQIEGEDVRIQKNRASKRIGCVIENPGVYPNLTGYENLKYFAKISGVTGVHEIDMVIEKLGIKAFIHKKAKKYSLGMKQRLGLAQSVFGNPRLLVLDEPTNGLDPNVIMEIRKFIKDLSKEQGKAIIISSHILSEIEVLCDRIIFIKNGKIIETSKTKIQTDDGTSYVFETDDDEKLVNYFEEKGILCSIESDHKVIAELNDYTAQEIIVDLALRDIKVYELYKFKKSLEKEFLDIMGGNIVG